MITVLASNLAANFAQDTITRTSTGEAVTFWVLGPLAVIGALGVVLAVNAVYSAMFLAMTMIILAVFYMVQDALFLGVVQVVVYTGAVMMLFLFVLMLIGVDSAESLKETLRGQRVAAVVTGLGEALLYLIGTLIGIIWHGYPGEQPVEQPLLLQPIGQGTCRVQEFEFHYRAGRDDTCGQMLVPRLSSFGLKKTKERGGVGQVQGRAHRR